MADMAQDKKEKHIISKNSVSVEHTFVQTQDGLWSWVVCVCAMVNASLVQGFGFSFGVVIPQVIEHFHVGREQAAWVQSVSLSLMTLLGPATGPLCERLGCGIVTMSGGFLCAVALAASSFVSQLELLYFTYGVLFGVGNSFVFTAGFLLMTKYFTRWRSLALSLVSMGMGGGILALGPILQILLDSLGLRGTLRAMAGAMSLVILLSCTYLKNTRRKVDSSIEEDMKETDVNTIQETEHEEKRITKLVDFSVWRVPAYSILTISATIAMFSEYIPLVHLTKHIMELGTSAEKASEMYIYMGISTVIARPLSGIACNAGWVKPQVLYELSLIVNGISTLLLPLAHSYVGLACYVVAYGACDGVFLSMLNVMIMSCVEPERRAFAYGMELFLTSLTRLAGVPLAGWIADKNGSYNHAFYMAGAISIVGGLSMFSLHCIKRRQLSYVEEQDIDVAIEAGKEHPSQIPEKEERDVPELNEEGFPTTKRRRTLSSSLTHVLRKRSLTSDCIQLPSMDNIEHETGV